MTPPAVAPIPFTLHIEGDVLDDLRQRLARTRWPDEPPGPAWSSGSSVAYMQALVEHWRSGFDWRGQEAALNRFRGGHFAALEQPEALAPEIRAFFRPLRLGADAALAASRS